MCRSPSHFGVRVQILIIFLLTFFWSAQTPSPIFLYEMKSPSHQTLPSTMDTNPVLYWGSPIATSSLSCPFNFPIYANQSNAGNRVRARNSIESNYRYQYSAERRVSVLDILNEVEKILEGNQNDSRIDDDGEKQWPLAIPKSDTTLNYSYWVNKTFQFHRQLITKDFQSHPARQPFVFRT